MRLATHRLLYGKICLVKASGELSLTGNIAKDSIKSTPGFAKPIQTYILDLMLYEETTKILNLLEIFDYCENTTEIDTSAEDDFKDCRKYLVELTLEEKQKIFTVLKDLFNGNLHSN